MYWYSRKNTQKEISIYLQEIYSLAGSISNKKQNNDSDCHWVVTVTLRADVKSQDVSLRELTSCCPVHWSFVPRLLRRNMEKNPFLKLRNYQNLMNWAFCISGDKSDILCTLLIPCLLDLIPHVISGSLPHVYFKGRGILSL